jgi:hypothetical protein
VEKLTPKRRKFLREGFTKRGKKAKNSKNHSWEK